MKKIIAITTAALVLTIALASAAYAADKIETPQWFKDMITWKKDQVDQAVKDGKLTEEEANEWKEHFDEMEEWHNENGFGYGYGPGFGGCGRGFRGGYAPGYNQQSYRGGYGPGMMGYWQNQ